MLTLLECVLIFNEVSLYMNLWQ